MKLRAISAEQCREFLIEGIFRPSDEASPVILELFPDDLDEIQFGTVGREIDEKCAMVDQPPVQDVIGDVVMSTRIVEDDQSRASRIALTDHLVEEGNDTLAVDRAGMCGGTEFVGTEVQCTQHGARAVPGRFRCMRLPQGRPGSLHRWRSAERRLVEIDQPDDSGTRSPAGFVQRSLLDGKFFLGPFFLSEKRVLLNDKPRLMSPLRSVPNEHGRGA